MQTKLEDTLITLWREHSRDDIIPSGWLTCLTSPEIETLEIGARYGYCEACPPWIDGAYGQRIQLTPRGRDLIATADAIGYEPQPVRYTTKGLATGRTSAAAPNSSMVEPTESCPDCGGLGEKPLFSSSYTCETCNGAKIVPVHTAASDVPEVRASVLTLDELRERVGQRVRGALRPEHADIPGGWPSAGMYGWLTHVAPLSPGVCCGVAWDHGRQPHVIMVARNYACDLVFVPEPQAAERDAQPATATLVRASAERVDVDPPGLDDD